MSSKAGTVQAPKRRNSQVIDMIPMGSKDFNYLKPEPPQDLWAQLDKISAEAKMNALIQKGPDMFTAAEYGRRYGIGSGSACDRLRKLADAGKIEFVGIGVNNAKFYRIKKS